MIELLKKIEDIPELPQVAYKILEEATKDNCNYETFSKYIESSPALMLKIFQIINSPFYGFPNKITNLSQAIGLLGISNVKNLALTVFILDILQSFSESKDSIIQEWKFLITTGTSSKILSEDESMFLSTLISFLPQYLSVVFFNKKLEFDFDIFSKALKIISDKWYLPEFIINNVKNYFKFKIINKNFLKNNKKNINLIYISEIISKILLLEGAKPDYVNKLKELLNFDDKEFLSLIQEIDVNTKYLWNLFRINSESIDYADVVAVFSRANNKIHNLLIQNQKIVENYNTVNTTLNVALNNVPLGVLMFEKHNLVLINQKAEDIIEKKINSLKDIFEKEILEHLLKTKNKFNVVTEIKGTNTPVEVMFVKLTDDENRELLFLKDLREEYKLKKQYRNLKENYVSIINAAGVGICLINTNAKILFVNKKFCEIFKGDYNKFIGKIIHNILCLSETCVNKINPVLKKLIKNMIKEKRLELETKDLKGNKIFLEVIITLYKEGDNIIGFQFVINNITEKKELEIKHLKLQDEFMRLEKDKIAMELAGAAAHELNQPLTSLLLSIEMLRLKKGLDEKHLKNIETAGEKISEIVKKIGKITKYETQSYIGTQNIIDLHKSDE